MTASEFGLAALAGALINPGQVLTVRRTKACWTRHRPGRSRYN